MIIAIFGALLVAIAAGIIYTRRDRGGLTSEDLQRLKFLKDYVSFLESERLQNVITEAEYQIELQSIDEEVAEYERRAK